MGLEILSSSKTKVNALPPQTIMSPF